MSTVDKLLSETRFLKGEVINDPQTWTETNVSGGGGGGSGHYRSSIHISSKTNTWTSFLIETETGKEFMVKWPESASVRKGHFIKVAVFRDQPIACINEKTDTKRHLTKIEGMIGWWSESKAFSTPIAYGGLLVSIILAMPTFSLSFLGWIIFAGRKKAKIYKTVGGLPEKALEFLKTK